jgi:hypothetical protein
MANASSLAMVDAMNTYWCRFLDERERHLGAEKFIAVDDTIARERASELFGERSAAVYEILNGNRVVYRGALSLKPIA